MAAESRSPAMVFRESGETGWTLSISLEQLQSLAAGDNEAISNLVDSAKESMVPVRARA